MGEPGRKAVMSILPALKAEFALDMVIANGENAAAGRGITPKIALDLMRAGISVITTGDHVWDQQELVSWLPLEPRVLRPLNYPEGTVGQGSVVLSTTWGNIAVVQVQGRSFIQPPLENPFVAMDKELARLKDLGCKVIVVDIHAETTSEKMAMGYYLDGRVSALLGTHTHVQTADEVILVHGTAYLTDAGMCGPAHSVLGREVEAIVRRFVTAMPTKFPVAKGPVRVCGAVIDIDEKSGRARHIERIQRLVE